jgi:hypothetical protein
MMNYMTKLDVSDFSGRPKHSNKHQDDVNKTFDYSHYQNEITKESIINALSKTSRLQR